MKQKYLLNKILSWFGKPRRYLNLLRDLSLIRSSHLFDKNWYLANNPEIAQYRMGPALHYLRHGGFEGRDPGPNFHSNWYRDAYGDERDVELNPLVHYLKYGQKEGRLKDVRQRDLSLIRTCGLFDEAWYLENNSDVVQSGMDPALHYLLYGAFEGRDPSQNFHMYLYLDFNKSVKRAGMNPFIYYLIYIWREGRGIKSFKLARMYNYCRQANRIVFEDQPERIYVHRPKIVGGFVGELCEGEAVCPRPYVSVLEDVVIFGRSSLVITRENIVLSDELVDFNTREYGKKSYRVKDVNGDTVMFEYNGRPEMQIREGVLLSCGHDANYFHWLVECLPKLLLIDDLKEYRDVPLLVPAGLHRNLMKALERVNVNHRQLIIVKPDTACHVERLIFPSALSQMNDRYIGNPIFNVDVVLSHKWLARIGKQLKGSVNYNTKPWRIFLARRNKGRVLENQEQLELLLLEHGFEVIELDGVSLDFQIALFSQTVMIVSQAGAALTNMLLCQPGTKVVILTSNHEAVNHHVFSELGAIAGLDVKMIVGERLFNVTTYESVHDDYVIDTELVLDEIKGRDRK